MDETIPITTITPGTCNDAPIAENHKEGKVKLLPATLPASRLPFDQWLGWIITSVETPASPLTRSSLMWLAPLRSFSEQRHHPTAGEEQPPGGVGEHLPVALSLRASFLHRERGKSVRQAQLCKKV